MPLEVTFLDTLLVGKIKLLIVEGYHAESRKFLPVVALVLSSSFLSLFPGSNMQYVKLILYTHHFICIFPGYITNQFHNQLPSGLLAKLVSAAQVLQRSGNCNFINCIFTCDNLLLT